MGVAVQVKVPARRCGGRTIASRQSASALVDEAGLDSFPASDPPGWTLGARDYVEIGQATPSSRLG